MPSIHHLPVRTRSALLAAAALVLAGCGEIHDEVPIEQTLDTGAFLPAVETPELDASTRDRLSVMLGPEKAGPFFTYYYPSDWRLVSEEGSRRLADFRFGGNGEGECSITVLPGDAGGVVENIDRWRGQMGGEPMTPEDFAQLQTIRFMTGDAVGVDISGDYTALGETEAKKGYRMLGAILEWPSMGTFFAKMVGPAELVELNRIDFLRVCRNFSLNEGANR